MDPASQLTELIARFRGGDLAAAEELVGAVYQDLHARARQMMADEPRESLLQPTALVSEVWLRIAGQSGIVAGDRRHFLRLATRAMRNILVDEARRRRALRRGGGVRPASLPDQEPTAPGWNGVRDELIDLDAALERLGQQDAELTTVVELQYFAGMTLAEIGDVLGMTIGQVHRASTLARAWLQRELRGDRDGGP